MDTVKIIILLAMVTCLVFTQVSGETCAEARKKVEDASQGPVVIGGAFLPRCDANGKYEKKQVHGSTLQAWCSDPDGNVIGEKRPATTDFEC